MSCCGKPTLRNIFNNSLAIVGAVWLGNGHAHMKRVKKSIIANTTVLPLREIFTGPNMSTATCASGSNVAGQEVIGWLCGTVGDFRSWQGMHSSQCRRICCYVMS